MSNEGGVIVAVASGAGTSAISLIRVSGSGAVEVVDRCCSVGVRHVCEHHPREQRLARIEGREGNVIDEVLVSVFPGPRSYTGEDVIEVGCHGGRLVTDQVVGRLVECGGRLARAGEFTERAFLNGKMDLTQAEAVMDLIEAQTDLALRAAHGQLSGKLGSVLSQAREDLLGVLGHLEAHIDFPEEGLSPDTASTLADRLGAVSDLFGDLARTSEMGRFLREGVKTVICGEPNVGKSSLLNHLLGFDRAIVSEKAGTTRDTIEEVVNLGGFPVRLIDTAGLRDSDDEIEQAGIARTREKLVDADFVIEVVDASQPAGERVGGVPDGGRAILILNKCDLGEDESWHGVEGLRVSCRVGDGLGGLEEAITARLIDSEVDVNLESLISVNARHRQCLDSARGALHEAIAGLKSSREAELVSIDLRQAMDAVGEVVGKVDAEELLGEIFGSFCVGK